MTETKQIFKSIIHNLLDLSFLNEHTLDILDVFVHSAKDTPLLSRYQADVFINIIDRKRKKIKGNPPKAYHKRRSLLLYNQIAEFGRGKLKMSPEKYYTILGRLQESDLSKALSKTKRGRISEMRTNMAKRNYDDELELAAVKAYINGEELKDISYNLQYDFAIPKQKATAMANRAEKIITGVITNIYPKTAKFLKEYM